MRYLAYIPYNQKERLKWYNCVLKHVSSRLVISSTMKLHLNIHILDWGGRGRALRWILLGYDAAFGVFLI